MTDMRIVRRGESAMVGAKPKRSKSAYPSVEILEDRCQPAVTASLAGGVLSIQGDAGRNSIHIGLDSGMIVVRDFAAEVGRFASSAVASIAIGTGAGDDVARIASDVYQPVTIFGDAGRDALSGGGGTTTLNGGLGSDKLRAGAGMATLNGGAERDTLLGVKANDIVVDGASDRVGLALPPVAEATAVDPVLTASEVQALLIRASAATASEDAIIAIVDRNGRLLGLRVEQDVNAAFQGGDGLVFAADGAIAKARTGAFFASNAAPLTSRTVQFISQTTMTEREIDSYPSITDPNSTLRGPGFVAPIGIKSHFPPNVPFTPQVDLFAIEHTNRDTAQGLSARFNIDPSFVPLGKEIFAPESYGYYSGLNPDAQSRGIATLPGGIPLYKDGKLVGGIGVFFPGSTGFATAENSALDAKYDSKKPDRSLEAEYIAFATAGGSTAAGFPIGTINGVPPLPGFDLPSGRIDLVSITLDIFGPGGVTGAQKLVAFGQSLGVGAVNGTDQRVASGATLLSGLPVPEGWLVTPHDGVGISASEVERIIQQGITQANDTRAAIRLPLNSSTRMVFAVTDTVGEVVGLFRMPDATVFSIDVAVAKARNVAYYADPGKLQPIDQVDGAAPGTAITNRSIRYLALPRYPEGIDGRPPGQFSILNDGGVDPTTGLQVGPRLPASAFQSVQGYDAFNPRTNFRDPANKLNQNGIVFFPGSSPVYRESLLSGGFGVSGDGVDQDDVVTGQGILGFDAPQYLRIDEVFSRGVRVPYMKYNRNPEGGVK